MPRVAVLGGGIAGLTAAYELERSRQAGEALDWHLFEASRRAGGLLRTTRLETSEGEYILEDGPDGWLTDKPWAANLARELGLGDDLLPCNEGDRRTYLWSGDRLDPLPERMRLMVPADLAALEHSPLFSPAARQAYAAETERAEELRAEAPDTDESVATFVRRHFGEEVLARLAAPLLAGVFGGDVEKLSVRAVMPAFVQMEREYGSLVLGLQAGERKRRLALSSDTGSASGLGVVAAPVAGASTFTSLRRGMGSLTEALIAALPPERLHVQAAAEALRRTPHEWLVRFAGEAANSCAIGFVPFDRILVATPTDVSSRLLAPAASEAARLLPTEASSAVLVTLCWPPSLGQRLQLPPGFGFLVPPAAPPMPEMPKLLAGTFAHQKYPHRAPAGAKIIRAFFGSHGAHSLLHEPDSKIVTRALAALEAILGPLPAPETSLTTVRRWPRSLPQYAVGHLDRMAALERHLDQLGGIQLLGNSYYGVGVPDLIRDARAAVRTLVESLP